MVYSPIVSISEIELVGIHNALTYSGSIIVSRIVASCFTSRFASHEICQLRYSIFRLWKRIATMLNFTAYTDEFYGDHPLFSYRLVKFLRESTVPVHHYARFTVNLSIPMIILVSFIWMINKTTFYLINRSFCHSSTPCN
ncbi:unnamed protein product [Rotaria sp. Silwood1]|nr:unnamed protein product [Rotaria sp. Silwood1]